MKNIKVHIFRNLIIKCFIIFDKLLTIDAQLLSRNLKLKITALDIKLSEIILIYIGEWRNKLYQQLVKFYLQIIYNDFSVNAWFANASICTFVYNKYLDFTFFYSLDQHIQIVVGLVIHYLTIIIVLINDIKYRNKNFSFYILNVHLLHLNL